MARLLPLLLEEAKAAGVASEVLSTSPITGVSPPALASAIIRLSGAKAEELVAKWLGTIQWIGQSPYRPTHKRKNWFVGVFKVDTHLDVAMVPSNLNFQSMRASGPGGQNVNKTNSAVRARDMVTGEVVTASSHRSQAQNRRAAVRKIAQRLVDKAEEANSAREQSRWDKHQELVRGNPTRIFHDNR